MPNACQTPFLTAKEASNGKSKLELPIETFFFGACDGETTSVTNIVLCGLLKGGVPRRVAPLISEDFFSDCMPDPSHMPVTMPDTVTSVAPLRG